MSMNLLESMYEPYVMMDKVSVDDDVGTFKYTWVEGATFNGYVKKVNAPEVTIAEQQGVNELFIVIVPKPVPLEYHDVFKRLSDGAVFRMTSLTLDDAAPAASTVQIAKGNCERWELT